jgi:hypothetical protein
MEQPRVNMSGFVRYASAPAGRRRRSAQLIRSQSGGEYNPGTDFWKRMRLAIYNDRKTSRDGSALVTAVETAIPQKRPSFKAVADQWAPIAARWNATEFQVPDSATVVVGGLEVGVRALFAEQWPDGGHEDVVVWMNEDRPAQQAVMGAMRLLARADPSLQSIATFVDARRGQVWSSSKSDLVDLDGWLEELGSQFLEDWNEQ